jgi:hypothetical protein
MKRKLMLSAFGAISCTVFLAAQSTIPNTNKTNKAAGTRQTVIVTGCLDDGGEAGGYLLTSVAVSGTPKARATATPNSGTIGIAYTLIGSELQSYVGHKVEVTGLIEPLIKKSSTKPSDRDKAVATAQAMNGTLTVTSLKMISPTCS